MHNLGKASVWFLFILIFPMSVLAAQGDRDTSSFGSPNGYVITSSTLGTTGASAVALQPDGKIVVAGYVTGTPRLLVARYNPDGTLDATFGGGTGTVSFSQTYSEGFALAIHDDKIIVVGGTGGWGTGVGQMLVLRLTGAGALDTATFNAPTGYATWHNPDTSVAHWSSQAFGVAIQDGKIVVTGYTEVDYGGDYDLVLLRYNDNGTLDATFGASGTGVVQVANMTYDGSFGGSAMNDDSVQGRAVAIQPWNAKIVVAAKSGNNHSALYRFDANGTLDTSFGPLGNGMTIPFSGDFSDPGGLWGAVYPKALAIIEYDRKILMAAINGNPSRAAVVVRYLETGVVDTTYGTGGQAVSWHDGTEWGWHEPMGMALQDDGKVVLAGTLGNQPGDDFVVLRFTRSGILDTTFGTDGWVTFNGPLKGNDEGMGVAIQPDGNILAVGYTWDGSSSYSFDAIVLRLIGDPPTIHVSPASDPYDFGSVVVPGSKTQSFTVTNTGGMVLEIGQIVVTGANAADFVLQSDNCSNLPLDPAGMGDSCTFQIRFTPGTTGLRTATFSIPSIPPWSDPVQNPYDVALQGNGTTLLPGVLAVGPGAGLTSSGIQGGPFSPSSKDYTLQNTGEDSINWTASKTHAWVTLSSSGGTLAGGASTTVTVSINAGANSLAAGPYSDMVTFANTTNGNGNTSRGVSLTVTSPGVLVVAQGDGLNSSGAQGGPFSPWTKDYILQNTGENPINWTASKTQTWVTLSSSGGTLPAGGSTTVTVSINGGAGSLVAGLYSDTVTFTNTTNGNGNTARNVSLTVTPPPGVLSVTPGTGFGSSGTEGGPFSPSSKDYILQNTGGDSINWTASKAQAWVTLSSSSGTLPALGSITVTVSINSGANSLSAGLYSDTVTFTNTTNGNGNTTRSVSLSVAAPQIDVDPVPVAFGEVNVEDETHLQVTISNTGDADLVVTSPILVTGGDAAMFGVAPGGSNPCASLAPTIGVDEFCTVIVKFAPTSEGAKATTLRIQSNDPLQPTWNVPVTGTGVLMPVTPHGTVGTAVIVRGSGFGEKKPKVLIGGKAIKVTSWTATEIRGLISKGLPPATYDVAVQQKGVPEVLISDAFAFSKPVIETVSPKEGREGNVITIQGFYFGTKKGKVYLGGKSCKIIKWNMISTTGVSEIQFAVPKKMVPGVLDLQVVVKVVGDDTDTFRVLP